MKIFDLKNTYLNDKQIFIKILFNCHHYIKTSVWICGFSVIHKFAKQFKKIQFQFKSIFSFRNRTKMKLSIQFALIVTLVIFAFAIDYSMADCVSTVRPADCWFNDWRKS